MNEKALKQYQRCWFIRAFEQVIAEQAAAGNVPGLVHLSTGSEVADVLLGWHLDWRRDHVTGSHRSHGLALACGAEPVDIAKEIMGRAGGVSDGIAGTQHLMMPEGETSFLTSNGIVGGQVPLAAGAALSAKARDGMDGIGVAVFGDGAANQGAVLETMNLVAALQLPMFFVLYNNGLAQSTSVDTATAGSYVDRAKSFGLHSWSADSADYENCRRVMQQGVAQARRCEPCFMEVAVTRDHGHHFGEAAHGESFDASQPLRAFGDWLREQGMQEKVLRAARRYEEKRARAVIEEAVAAPPLDAQAVPQHGNDSRCG